MFHVRHDARIKQQHFTLPLVVQTFLPKIGEKFNPRFISNIQVVGKFREHFVQIFRNGWQFEPQAVLINLLFFSFVLYFLFTLLLSNVPSDTTMQCKRKVCIGKVKVIKEKAEYNNNTAEKRTMWRHRECKRNSFWNWVLFQFFFILLNLLTSLIVFWHWNWGVSHWGITVPNLSIKQSFSFVYFKPQINIKTDWPGFYCG